MTVFVPRRDGLAGSSPYVSHMRAAWSNAALPTSSTVMVDVDPHADLLPCHASSELKGLLLSGNTHEFSYRRGCAIQSLDSMILTIVGREPPAMNHEIIWLLAT